MDLRIEPAASAEETAALVAEAGWTRAPGEHARRFAATPGGHLVARAPDGAAVGCVSVAAWPRDGGALGWIGTMIVSPRAQRQGVGRALLRAAIALARAKGATTIGLYATPYGEPLYKREGFVARGAGVRWERVAPQRPPASGGRHAIYPISSCEVMELLAYDKPRFGASRAPLLALLMSELPQRCFVAFDRSTGAISGFAMGEARYLGPVVADDEEAAARLVLACERAGAPAAVLAPPTNARAPTWLRALGYAPTDTSNALMTLGGELPGDPSCQVGIAAWALG